MTDQAVPQSFQPPYMSWATFQSIVEGFRAVGLPGQIDRSVLSSRSGGDQNQFLRTARAFGLIDEDGSPTPLMHEYVLNEHSRPQLLRSMLEDNYRDVIGLGVTATPQQLTEEFRRFGIEGDTVRKAIAFYINAAKLAEIPLSPHFKATRPGAGGRRSGTRKSSGKVKAGDSNDEQQQAPPATQERLPGIVAALVQRLPADGETWTADEADWWLDMARMTFPREYNYDPPEPRRSS